MADRRPGVPGPEGAPADPDAARPRDEAGVADGLRELGRALTVADPPADLAATVLARVDAEPVPRASRWRRAWDRVVVRSGQVRRVVVVAVVAALLTLGVSSPAAARIAEWLGLGAVVVVQAPAPVPAPVPTSGPGADPAPEPRAVDVSLPDARAAVAFPLGVPAALGDPDRVQVTDDGRIVTMTWADRPGLRLDQAAGEPEPYLLKRYYDEIELVVVGGAEGLWLSEPHGIEDLFPTGGERVVPPRTAGPTLIWQRGEVTLRLEGEPDRAVALAVAESVG